MGEIGWCDALTLPVHVLRSRLFSAHRSEQETNHGAVYLRTLKRREPRLRRFLEATARSTGRGAIKGGRIPARAIVLTGRFFPLFSPRMTGPDHRSPLLSGAFLVEGKYCSSSLEGYDFSRNLREQLLGVRFLT